jgi:hypothetical protein
MDMRNLLHWLGAAIDAQPFYSEEIGMIRLAFETWRHRLPTIDRRP